MKFYDVNYSGQVFTVQANDESEAIAKVRAEQSVDVRTSPVVTVSADQGGPVESAPAPAADEGEPEGDKPEGEQV